MKHAVAWMLGLSCAMWAGCADDDPGNLPGPTPGAPLLTRVDAESPGGHCALGGTAVHSGLDANRNGALDANEIQHTDYVCASSGDELWNGDFVAADWQDPAKVAALQHARVVLGSLTIAAPVALPALELVRDDLIVSSEATLPALAKVGASLHFGLGALAAPSLREIGSSLIAVRMAPGEVALPQLNAIGQDLRIGGNTSALHLEQLVSVGGDIELSPTTTLAVALPALTSVGGGVASNVSELASLELPVLEELTDRLTVWGSAALTRISLPKALSLGDVFIGGSALTTVELGVHFMHGQFVLGDAPALTALALPSLLSVGDHFGVQSTGLTNLAVPALAFVKGCVAVAANPALQSVAFPSLASAQCVAIYDSPPLTTVSLPKVEELDTLSVFGTAATTNLDFAALRTVRSFVDIRGAELDDLSGLHALTDVGQLHLERISGLHDLAGLTSLRRPTTVELISNPALASLSGLEQVTQVPGRLTIQDNPALTSTRGLQNVTHIGDLTLSGNPALAVLAFPHLLSIDSALRITGMTSLISLAGFDSLITIGGEIAITDNPALPAAAIDAFLARFPR